MSGMFSDAISFDRDISDWNVSNVKSMYAMFSGAIAFNQDISGWNVSMVSDMGGMFLNALSFNQNIGGWNVSMVNNMSFMFFAADAFNQDISGWNVSKVNNMFSMLDFSSLSTYHYEELLIAWNELDLQKGIDLGAEGKQYRARAQAARNSLESSTNHNWTITDGSLKTENDMPILTAPLPDTVLIKDFSSYKILIKDIFTDPDGDPLTLSVATGGDMAVAATLGNDTLTLTESGLGLDSFIMTATDVLGAQATDIFYVSVSPRFDSAFITTWKTTTANETIRIPTKGGDKASDYNFWIDWGDGTAENITGDNPNPSHTYAAAGTFTVRITGIFPHFYLNSDTEIKDKLLFVEQWGNIAWESMNSTFYGASNLNLNATDTPDLSNVTDMSSMFTGATAFNGDISNWNVSSVTDMSGMFSDAISFNRDISDWNVSNVKSMYAMFSEAIAFNQDISDWNVSMVSDMGGMFLNALAFNQDIGRWNVSMVNDMNFMFFAADAFNQDISGWNVSKVNNMFSMLDFSGLSTHHYEELLIAWNELELQKGIALGAEGKQYRIRAQAAHDSLTSATNHNWEINDGGLKNGPPVALGFPDLIFLQSFTNYKIPINSFFTDPDGDPLTLSVATGGDMVTTAALGEDSLTLILTKIYIGVDSIIMTATDVVGAQAMDTFLVTVVSFDSAFITTWKTTTANETIRIPITNAADDSTVRSAYDFYVDWGDGNEQQRIIGAEDPASHVYAAPGTYQIKITGTYPAFRLKDNPKASNLLSVDQWGNIAWESMNSAFYGASNLMIKATDTPNLSGVTDMSEMFLNARAFNQDIGGWNVSKVNNMAGMFLHARAFNQDIGGWNVSKVTNMAGMFFHAHAFNQDIGSWNVSKVTNMESMFSYAIAFDHDIGSWNVSIVTDMRYMFSYASAFNQDIGGWDVSEVNNMLFMFSYAIAFNQDIGRWNVSNVRDMNTMFSGATVFNQDIGEWNVSMVTDMSLMFNDAHAFNQDIGSWNVSIVTDMNFMFSNARAFNQDIGGWNVSMVTDMAYMFNNARAFNQDIGTWNVSIVTDMNFMFSNARAFNQDIGEWNVSSVTDMNEMFSFATVFNRDIGGWNVSGVTNMSEMFSFATVFNQDIGGWNVSEVTDMLAMFSFAFIFNQDIGGWNVSKVTDMGGMFYYATAFNQDIGGWNVSEVENMRSMFNYSNLSSYHYEELLIAWNELDLQKGVTLGAADIQYRVRARAAHASLTSPTHHNWTIIDGGLKNGMPLALGFHDLSFLQGFTSYKIPIDSLFTDLEGDILRLTVTTKGDMAIAATFENDALILTEIDLGATNVIVTANDGALQTIDTFLVTVKNVPPRIPNPLADLTLNNGFGTHDLDISNTFEDQQSLMYSVNAALGGVVTAVINGNTLTLTEVDTGTIRVIVTASDGSLQTTDTFLVTVKNNPPRIANPLADLTLEKGFATHNLDISNTFEDQQPLIFSVNAAPGGVLSAAVSGNTLTLTEVDAGTTRVIVTASDRVLETTDTFFVTIKTNVPPRITNPLADLTLNNGFVTRDLDISNTFEDQQPLMYSVNAAPEGVVSAAISGNTLKLTEVDTGSTNIIVTASDGVTQTTDTFLVIVKNNPPRVTNPLADLTLNNGFGTHDLDISNTFEDQQPLIFSVNVASAEVLSAVINGNTLTLTEVDAGTTRVIVTASDRVLETTDTFLVTVVFPPFDSAFITTWKTTTANDTIGIPITKAADDPTVLSIYDFYVDWGDRSEQQRIIGAEDPASHVYAVPGTYQIKITGTYPAFRLKDNPKASNLLSVDKWGNIAWESMNSAFYDANNLMIKATDTPNLSGVTDMSEMFFGASVFNQNIGGWNVSMVTNMGSMFARAIAFNQDIENWNISKVTNMAGMFLHAHAFNQDIGSWNVSMVTNMGSMFSYAYVFDQDIGGWSVDSVTNMRSMFSYVRVFNQDISGWNVSKVTNMSEMFRVARVFNQDIGGWNVSKVTDMGSMFSRAFTFNQNISGWNVSKVTDMSEMFQFVRSFNSDINGWNVSNVQNMQSMFNGARRFNRDIKDWDVSKVTDMTDMLNYSGLSTHHYEELLIAWNELDLQKDVTLGAASIEYRVRAKAAHDSLTSDTNHNWTIIDGGLKIENNKPVAVGFSDLVLLQGFSKHYILISSLFTDSDGDTLKLTITTGGDMAIAATFENDTLTLTELATGTTNIIITASDGVLKTTDTFLVTIKANVSPRIANPLADLILEKGFETHAIDISKIFKDEQPLTISVKVATAGAVNALVSGNILTLTEVNTGSTNIIITASDGSLKTTDTFLVTIKANVPPRIANPLADLTLEKGFETHEIDISKIFKDEQPLTISVKVATAGVVNALVSGNILTLTEVNTGSTNIIVTASDGVLQTTDTFLVTIKANVSPRVTNPLADLILEKGFETHAIDISNTFEDQQPLTISVMVATAGVVNALVSGNILTLTEVNTGSTNIIVTASDGVLKTTDTFLVTIKANVPPRIANPLADLTLEKGFKTHAIDISNVFEDEQPLTISVKVATAGMVNALVSGNILTLTEVDTGATHVIVTASDGVLKTTDTFLVTVKNNPPRIANPLADLTLEKGFETHAIDISNVFKDQQPLTISVKVATAGVITTALSGDTLTLTELATGTTNIIITASDGVTQTTDTFFVTVNEATSLITAIEGEKELVKLYPNPTTGTVSLDLGSVRKALMKVYTLRGNILFEKVLLENTYHVELPGSAGIYLVEIITMDNRQIIKLVRE